MSRLRAFLRWPLRLIGALLLLALLLPLALLGLLATERGTAWTLEQAVELARSQGIELSLAGSSGHLFDRLVLEDVVFAGGGSRVEVGRLLLDWRPRALLDRMLHLEAVEAAELRVVPPPPSETPPASEPPQIPEIALPLAVRLDRFLLEDLTVEQPGGPLRVARAAFAATLDAEGLELRDLDLAAMGATVAGRLGMRTAAPHALDGELTAEIDEGLSGPEVGPVAVQARLGGEALRPSLALALTAPAALTLEGTLDLTVLPLRFDLNGDWAALSWPLRGEPTVSASDGRLALTGTPEDYHLKLTTGLRGPQLPAAAIDLAAQGDLGGVTLAPLRVDALDGHMRVEGKIAWADGLAWQLQLVAEGVDPSVYLPGTEVGAVAARARLFGSAQKPAFVLEVSAPAALRLEGAADLSVAPPRFDLNGDWAALSWPLSGEPMVSASDGRLVLTGTPEDYRLTLTTGLGGPQVPAASIDLAAQGDLSGVKLAPLSVDALDGQVRVEGTIGWADAPAWQLQLVADDLDPGVFLPEWRGRLGARVDVAGSIGEALAVSATIHELAGRLRDYPVSAQGAVDYDGAALRLKAVEFASGSNRVALDGRVAEQLELNYDIKAPDLASLYPGLSGRLEGAGRLEGTPAAPLVAARLSGEALSLQDFGAERLSLEVDWRETGGKGSLRVTGIDAGEAEFSELRAGLDGTPQAHRLEFAVEGPPLSASLSARGGLDQQIWQGSLNSLRLAREDVGEWRLKDPVALRLGATQARSERLCLVQGTTQLCAAGGWQQSGAIDLAGSLTGLDLNRLDPFLPAGTAVEGSLAASFELGGSAEAPRLDLSVRPSDGRVRVETADEPFELAYRDVRLDGRFADDRGSAELRLKLGSNGQAQGRFELGPDRAGGRTLGGRVDADFPDLGLVAGFVPALREVAGQLHLEAALGGTLEAPRVLGELAVRDAQAQVPAAGIDLRELGLTVRGTGDGPLRIQGGVSSGDGRIELSGTVDPTAPRGPSVDLRIDGQDFQAVRLLEAMVNVSPQLRLQGSGPYDLSGMLRIPYAKIVIKGLPSGTVAVSEDQIIVGEEEAQAQPKAPPNLTAKVRVELGDEVSFDGFGLVTGLSGAVLATVDERSTSVDGKIELRDARYQAYGQDLTVEQGRLLFAGPPGNPDIDLRAVRVSRDGGVKAYLAMSGPLSKPRPRIYTEPSLPDAQAVAYLVTGRGLDEAGQGDGVNIANAALSLGLSKSEPLMQDLSSRLGLDELRVEGGANGLQDSSLLVGKYLNPDLYLGYSQGLFNPEGAVLLRLRLNERLDVETRSGNEQSVDLFYRYEHD